MQIEINWVNRNTGEDGTYVYRSESPIDVNNLPVPIATLATGITTYVDTTVVRDKLYYYRFGIFKGSDVAISNETPISTLANTGPGPQVLKRGNHHLGYYGEVPESELFTSDTLRNAIGLTEGNLVAGGLWHKFIRHGRILFIPAKPLSTYISWTAIYNAGAVFGVDGFGGPLPTGQAGVNQKKIVTKDGNNYLVRLIKGLPDGVTSWTNISQYDTTGLEGSEWNDLIYKIAVAVAYSGYKPMGNGIWASLTYTEFPLNNPAFCQEIQGASSVIIRGAGYATNSYYPGYAATISATIQYGTHAAPIVNSSSTVHYGWRPVLELTNEVI